MAFGGNDWLAMTPEEALEPELPICDAHHHFYEFRKDRVPYQRYLLDEYAADVNAGHNVRSTVFVNCHVMYRADGPEELKAVGEVEFVQGMAAASASGQYGPGRIASAIVSQTDLGLGAEVCRVLEALRSASPNRFRGIRQNPTFAQMKDATFQAGAHELARMGLTLDIYPKPRELQELATFARLIPDLRIIVNHLAWDPHPELMKVNDDNTSGILLPVTDPVSEATKLDVWKEGMQAIASCPNVYLKLGGLGMPRAGFTWHARFKPIGSEELAAAMRPILSFAIDQFGPSRCMFESNFPVDKFSFSYSVMYNAYKRATRDFRADERLAMFHDTAVSVYGIEYASPTPVRAGAGQSHH
jgi:predicted TIM-barrel fold metal-dependent hydrolase